MFLSLSTVVSVTLISGLTFITSLPSNAGFIVQSSRDEIFEKQLAQSIVTPIESIYEYGKEGAKKLVNTLAESLVYFYDEAISHSSNIEDYTKEILELRNALDVLEPLEGSDYNQNTKEFLTSKRKYQFEPDQPAKWLTPIEANWIKIANGTKYFDVTNNESKTIASWAQEANLKPKIPEKLTKMKVVEPIKEKLDEGYMITFLKEFTSFENRNYKSDGGVKAVTLLQTTLSDIIKANSATYYTTLDLVEHDFLQNSLIATIKGTSKAEEVVILGAHVDSINQSNPWFGKAPGADDDGSGVIAILSAFKAILESGFKPERSLEFHFYAGEEDGLLGSQSVALSYSEQKIPVVAMINFDMTGYFNGKEKIAIVQDFTDRELNNLLRKMVSQYTRLPSVGVKCGYACSDHGSWNKLGFRAVYPTEDPNLESNIFYHSSDDTVDTLNFHHIHQFANLAIGFAVELSF